MWRGTRSHTLLPTHTAPVLAPQLAMLAGEHVQTLQALVRKVAALESKVQRLEASDDARGKQDEQFQVRSVSCPP